MRNLIRSRLLIIILLLIAMAVGAITYAVVHLIHTEKIGHLYHLTSAQATDVSNEVEELFKGYLGRLEVFSRIMASSYLSPEQKSELVSQLFDDDQEFVAVALFEGESEKAMFYDAASLEAAGLDKADLINHRRRHPFPDSFFASDDAYIENSTLHQGVPTLTLSIHHALGAGKPPLVSSATVRLGGLHRLAERSGTGGDIFIFDGNGRLLTHSDLDLKDPSLVKLPRVEKSQGMVQAMEYELGEKEMIGAVAYTRAYNFMVGVQSPKSTANLSPWELLKIWLIAALGGLVVVALVSLLWFRYITRPLQKLTEATRRIARGQFDVQVETGSRDEFSDLAAAVNQMAVRLDQREADLKQANTRIVQEEKLTAFGRIGSCIAHEVKNPLAGILGFAQLALRKAGSDSPLHKYLSIIEKETKRCQKIIEDLMKFARKEEAEFEATDINAVIEDAASISEKELGPSHVSLETELTAGLPRFMGNGQQIRQVLMDLTLNARQAMGDEAGTIRVSSRQLDSGQIEMRLRDSGPGMSQEVQDKIFEPFFTTRPSGEGTGLGLTIGSKIIQEHKGAIWVESEPGEGATFVITLPALVDDKMMAEEAHKSAV